MSKRTFPLDLLDELRWGLEEGYEKVSYELSHQTRWSTYYEFVFKHDGKLWSLIWGEGSTEMQETPMWGDTVEAIEVVATEVTKIKYVPVDKDGDQ